MDRKNNKYLSLAVALALAILSGLAAGGVYLNRDRYFDLGKAKVAGKLDDSADARLLSASVAYAEKTLRRPEQVCVSRWLGKDDRFVYLAFGCAKFATQFGELHAYGDQGFRALRLRHWWGWILGMDEADPERLAISLRRLYPPEVNDLWWKKSSPLEYLKEGGLKASAP